MPWLAVTLTVDASRAEALSDALLSAGAMAVETTDADAGTARETAWFDEPGEARPSTWKRATVGALFDEAADIAALLADALSVAAMDPAQNYTVARVEDRDWVRATQGQFRPVRVSARMWVVPTWHAPPDPAAVNLVIDPGLAFGTGTHPSTRLCLEWVETAVRGGESILDYGCGSGILAIAAMKLGAARATGVDIDAAALVAARHNAMQNEVTAQFVAPDDPLIQTADIVLANILANPLQVLAPLLARVTRAGGRIALSGILDDQAMDVTRAYSPWFALSAWRREEGWVLLEGARNPP